MNIRFEVWTPLQKEEKTGHQLAFLFKINIILIKTIIKSMQHLIFRRKCELNELVPSHFLFLGGGRFVFQLHTLGAVKL